MNDKLTLEEKVDVLSEGVGVLLLYQHGFRLPEELLFHLVSTLGLNLTLSPLQRSEQIQ